MGTIRIKPDMDNQPLNFGKYKGKAPGDIAEDDPEYVVWLYENIDPKVCSRALYRSCQNHEEDEYYPDGYEKYEDGNYWR